MKEITLLPAFRPLFVWESPYRYFILEGGRGSGKSFHVALWALNATYMPNQKIIYTRWTLTSAAISIIPEFVHKIELLNKEPDFIIRKNLIQNRLTGSMIVFKGVKSQTLNNISNLTSIQGASHFIMDEAHELVDETTFDRIDMSFRTLETKSRLIMVVNPTVKKHWIYQRFHLQKNNLVKVIHTTYLDNIKNLNPDVIQIAENAKKTNLLRYENVFLGKWMDSYSGNLWNYEIIERQKTTAAPPLIRKVIAIDPALTAHEKSDETGIILAGISEEGLIYVLQDLSGKYTPATWGQLVATCMNKYNADCYVAEKNNGGDLVTSLIRQFDQTSRIKLVHARVGKYLRAEPVYSLYEQGRVFHVGDFVNLEYEMLTVNVGKLDQSPNRLDALVYAVQELIANHKSNSRIFGGIKI